MERPIKLGLFFARPYLHPCSSVDPFSLSWVRPYLVENTTSRPICEVKQPQAQLVLRSVMTWEPWVLYSLFWGVPEPHAAPFGGAFCGARAPAHAAGARTHPPSSGHPVWSSGHPVIWSPRHLVTPCGHGLAAPAQKGARCVAATLAGVSFN